MFEHLDDIVMRNKELLNMMSEPDVANDSDKLQKVMKEQGELQPLVDAYLAYKKSNKAVEENLSMLNEEKDEDLREMIKEELLEEKERVKELENKLKILLLPKDPNDDKNVIVEIRGGAGGEEACLFAYEVYRMYLHFAERKGWKVELLEYEDT